MTRPALYALLASLALGGGAVALGALPGCSDSPEVRRAEAKATGRDAMADLRAYVAENLAGSEARAGALAAVEDLERGLDRALAETEASLSELRRANARYEATRSELQAVMDGLTAKRKATRAAVVAAHIKLRDLTPPEQWSKVFELESEAVRAKVSIAPGDVTPSAGDKGRG